MLFKQKLGQNNVTSQVERVSRFIVILKNPNKRTKPVMLCPAGDCAAICREGKDHERHQRPPPRLPPVHNF